MVSLGVAIHMFSFLFVINLQSILIENYKSIILA